MSVFIDSVDHHVKTDVSSDQLFSLAFPQHYSSIRTVLSRTNTCNGDISPRALPSLVVIVRFFRVMQGNFILTDDQLRKICLVNGSVSLVLNTLCIFLTFKLSHIFVSNIYAVTIFLQVDFIQIVFTHERPIFFSHSTSYRIFSLI